MVGAVTAAEMEVAARAVVMAVVAKEVGCVRVRVRVRRVKVRVRVRVSRVPRLRGDALGEGALVRL